MSLWYFLLVTLVAIEPRFILFKWAVEIGARKMNFEEDFKIIATKIVPVSEGLEFPLGRGNFAKAYLVKEKKGPRNNR